MMTLPVLTFLTRMTNQISQIEQKEIRKALREQTIGYVTAALGLVAGLAWNDAIGTLISFIFPLSKNTLWAKFIYAILVTLLVVFLGGFLIRIFHRKQE